MRIHLKRFTLGTALLPVVLLLKPPALSAQDAGDPIVIGYRTSIRSEVLGEARPYWVYKPDGYDGSTEVYPVVYLLDGREHFHSTTGVVQFLAAQRRIPGLIVVAIPNTDDRVHDLSPPIVTDTSSRFPTAGGADAFLRFLRDELVPVIDSAYRTAPYRIVIGHSIGGLFAIYAMLSRPELFDAAIAISPSLWWDDEAVVRLAGRILDGATAERRGFLYMTMGNEGGRMSAGVWSMARMLELNAPPTFRWSFDILEQEDHGSVPLRSTYSGLEKLFEGWRLEGAEQLVAERGLAPVDAHYARLSERFGYEIRTPESVINQIGYGLLSSRQLDAAISAFQANVKRYPLSANVHDSLGDAYAAAGDWERARDSYARAVVRGRETSDPNLFVYEMHLENAQEKVDH